MKMWKYDGNAIDFAEMLLPILLQRIAFNVSKEKFQEATDKVSSVHSGKDIPALLLYADKEYGLTHRSILVELHRMVSEFPKEFWMCLDIDLKENAEIAEEIKDTKWHYERDFSSFVKEAFVFMLLLEIGSKSPGNPDPRFAEANRVAATTGDRSQLLELGKEFGLDYYTLGLEIKKLANSISIAEWKELQGVK